MADAQLAARLAGAVWGHVVGDAVGVPYEFRSAHEIRSVEFGAKGTHGQPPGTWSDDGALMLALLDSLLTAGFDPEDQAKRSLDWYRRGAYTPNKDGFFDIGNTTRQALQAFERGTPAEQAGPTDEHSGGNGSLMRILPLALVERDIADEELIEHAHRASRVTHGHARPQVACALYSLVVRRLLSGKRGRKAAFADAQRGLRAYYVAPERETYLRALDHLERWGEREGRGRVWDSFWSAWDAFAGASSYRETIERAIRYGNDTDTTAAITGGLAGLRFGLSGIPEQWLAGMRGQEIVEPLIARLIDGDQETPSRRSGLRLRLRSPRVPGRPPRYTVSDPPPAADEAFFDLRDRVFLERKAMMLAKREKEREVFARLPAAGPDTRDLDGTPPADVRD